MMSQKPSEQGLDGGHLQLKHTLFFFASGLVYHAKLAFLVMVWGCSGRHKRRKRDVPSLA